MKLHTKNLLSLFSTDIINRILGGVATIYLARTLDTSSFGIINFALAILSYGLIFANPGLNIIGTRSIAQKNVSPKPLTQTIINLKCILSLLVFCVGIIISLFFLEQHLQLTTVLFLCSLFPSAFLLEWYFQGKENLAIIGVGRTVWSIIYTAFIVLFVHSSQKLYLVPIAWGISLIIQATVLLFFYKQSVNDEEKITNTISWKTLLQQSFPVGKVAIITQILLNLPFILLGYIGTTTEIAHYSAASKLVFFLLVIDRILYFIFFPLLSRTFVNSPELLSKHVERLVKYLLILCLPICGGTILFSSSLISFIFGNSYEEASLLLQIQIWYFFFTVCNSIFSFTLLAIEKEQLYSRVTTFISICTILGIILFTYFGKSIGASYGMTIGEAILAMVMWYKVHTIISVKIIRHLLQSLLATFIMIGCLIFLPTMHIVFSILAGFFIYGIAIIIVGGFTKEDFLFIKERLV